jgi:DNA-binding response OmpR family regulator
MPNELILLVDDEPNIVQLAQMYLEREGYRTRASGDGVDALESVERFKPALMVLDVMLPKLDGIDVCRKLRADGNDLPILMLTARDEDVDKILGLEMGADDYLTKPFNPRELVARVKAILRRSEIKSSSSKSLLRAGDVVVDLDRHEVIVAGNQIALRAQEFDLLRVLLEHKGMVLSRERLLTLAWGYDYFGQTRTVDVHIGHLRRKLSNSTVQIETLTGVGYKLVD